MGYHSLTFILFITFVFLIYFVVPKKTQWMVLLIASYVFYFFASVQMSVFLIASTLITFYAGSVMGKINAQLGIALATEGLDKDGRKQLKKTFKRKTRAVLVCALILNFGILGVLKYYDFLANNLNALFTVFSADAALPHLNLLLPLGISFYIFQSSGYMIDVYRGKYAPDKNIAKFALFVSFFPQLIQGPISRYDSLAAQLTASHKFNLDSLKLGLQLVLWGFFKKLVIADRLSALVGTVFDSGSEFGFFVNALGSLAYGLQLYCDFSGGIDISRGIAEVMGIRMAQNFKRPYFAQNVAEFWRRWHITLGSWAKDYVFYPIVLSKTMSKLSCRLERFGNHIARVLPPSIATMVCFLMIGVWHGAAWKFVFFGLYYGLLIALSQLLNPLFNKMADKLKINRHCFSWRLFGILRTLFLVSIGRCITRSGGFMSGFTMLKSSLTHWDPWTLYDGTMLELGLSQTDYHIVFAGILILLVVGILQEKGLGIRATLSKQNLWFRWLIIIGAVIAVLLFGVYGPNYTAQSFIYAQF